MKTEKIYTENSHKDTKALRKNKNIYFKTSCLSALVAKKGFTLVEILTTIVIIAILMGVLLPALNMVKKFARDTQQKAQLASIEMGLNLYKNDFGDYPVSHGWDPAHPEDDTYCGAQTLAEAMVGQDLLGVHSDTDFTATGVNNDTPPLDCYPDNPASVTGNLDARKGPYLDRTHIGVFKASDVFTNYAPLSDRYLITDVFTVKKNAYKIGTPVLYYKANISAQNTEIKNAPTDHVKNIYNYGDNYVLAMTRINNKKNDPLFPAGDNGAKFYKYISDPMIPASPGTFGRPLRPDSFLLISAGDDGFYGTQDDICNFEPTFE